MTVHDAIASPSCSSATIAGLSRQLVHEVLALAPGALVRVNSDRIHFGAVAIPYLQPPAAATLTHVLSERPSVLLICNSMLRTLPQQVMMVHWAEQKRCGVELAAPPGESPHENGLALDVHAADVWVRAFEKHGWTYLGSKDPMHFQYERPGVKHDLGALSVKAFQILANRNSEHLSEDGVYGPATEAAVLRAPAGGWTK